MQNISNVILQNNELENIIKDVGIDIGHNNIDLPQPNNNIIIDSSIIENKKIKLVEKNILKVFYENYDCDQIIYSDDFDINYKNNELNCNLSYINIDIAINQRILNLIIKENNVLYKYLLLKLFDEKKEFYIFLHYSSKFIYILNKQYKLEKKFEISKKKKNTKEKNDKLNESININGNNIVDLENEFNKEMGQNINENNNINNFQNNNNKIELNKNNIDNINNEKKENVLKQIKEFNIFLRNCLKINFAYMDKTINIEIKKKVNEIDGLLKINDNIDLNTLNCDFIYNNNKENIISKKDYDFLILETKYGEGKNALYKKLKTQINNNLKIMKALGIQRIAYLGIIRNNNLYKNGKRDEDEFDNLKYEFKDFFKDINCYNIIIINLYQNKFLKNIDVTIFINEKKAIINLEKKFNKKFDEIINILKSFQNKESK